MTLFAGNYMSCHEKLSIKKEWNMVLRIVLITLLDILLGLSIIIGLHEVFSIFIYL